MRTRTRLVALTTLLLVASVQRASGQIVQNGSFESLPHTSTCATCYYYNPTDVPSWTFQGNTGIISGPGSNFNTPSPFPDGNQVAFLQSSANPLANQFYQSVVLTGGDYTLSYFDAGRSTACCGGNTRYDVFLGSILLTQQTTATDQAFGSHTISFSAAPGTYQLSFTLDPSTFVGDNTAFFDQVKIADVLVDSV